MMNRIAATRIVVGALIGSLTVGIALEIRADEHESGPEAGRETSGEEDRRAGRQAPPEASRATDETWQPTLYVPPSRGKARDTAAGGTRGIARKGSVDLAVLAPRDHVARTTRAQPTLYWYVSQDVDARVDVTVVDDSAIDPLLEFTVKGPIRAGIHALDLAGHGLNLEAGKVYSWNVAIVQDADRRSNDLLAEGFIERIGITGSLERSLRDASSAYAPYALSGIWYDAIAEIRSAIAAEPGDRRLLLQEVALLEQAELGEVARYAMKAGR